MNNYRQHRKYIAVIAGVFLLLLKACGTSLPEEAVSVRITQTKAAVMPTEVPALPPAEEKLMLSALVPAALREKIAEEFSMRVEIVDADQKQQGSLLLDISSDNPVAAWIYALAAPFPTIRDGLTKDELLRLWQGHPADEFKNTLIKTDAETAKVFTALWGEPHQDNVVIEDNPIEHIDFSQPVFYLLPFESLQPKLKVLQVDGNSPIQKTFDEKKYPLTVIFGIRSLTDTDIPLSLPAKIFSNRDESKLTDIILTGVTALVRGTALTMEGKGVLYPGNDIREITRSVDFMHVNNEIPFTPDCPKPLKDYETLTFCSDTRYYDLLEDIGMDIVEVSGDHFSDQGVEGALFTLDFYDEKGIPYYGGGRNAADARRPLLLEHNGNKIALLGCNGKNYKYYAPADEQTPGAIMCDFEWIAPTITRLKEDGYFVIMTFQHIEYYTYEPQPLLLEDFGHAASLGADIVSGSQSHQAHGFSFQNNTLIHYGLGNLFFDQYNYCDQAACNYAFMDRHVIYAGKHLSTEIIPIVFVDMARPRLMTPSEKASFLEMIFDASRWNLEDYPESN